MFVGGWEVRVKDQVRVRGFITSNLGAGLERRADWGGGGEERRTREGGGGRVRRRGWMGVGDVGVDD